MNGPQHGHCATNRRCRQPLTLMLTQGSWTALVCEKHAGLLLGRWLNLTSAKHDGKIAVTVRPHGDWSRP